MNTQTDRYGIPFLYVINNFYVEWSADYGSVHSQIPNGPCTYSFDGDVDSPK